MSFLKLDLLLDSLASGDLTCVFASGSFNCCLLDQLWLACMKLAFLKLIVTLNKHILVFLPFLSSLPLKPRVNKGCWAGRKDLGAVTKAFLEREGSWVETI